MASASNPFVDYLSRYTTASPDHEAAFDEFLAQAPPPAAGPLRLATRVEQFLADCFARPDPPSVILTGNAGDGKTYLCRRVVEAFGDKPFQGWDALAEQFLERDGVRLHVVKDLSELGEAQGTAMLRALAATLDGVAPERFLIAANEGRLRSLLGSDPALAALSASVDRQLLHGSDLEGTPLVVINLSQVTTSSFVPEALAWMTQPAHWDGCQACPAAERCLLRLNALRLRDELVVRRVQMLYQLLEQLDIHVTVRDMLIHLAYTITGNRRCEELAERAERHEELWPFAYYENLFGGPTQEEGRRGAGATLRRFHDGAFRRKASVIQHLARLHLGEHSLFEIDDFIVNGGQTLEQQAEHRRLFAAALDLDERRFEQDRLAYLSGGADRTAAEEERDLLQWLPHCRRKLFFEWRDEQQIVRLIPFLYLEHYRSLLRDNRGVREQLRRELVRGLNRAFSRLFLDEDEYLYVTTQYLHSGEQPRPLVRLRFPLTDIELRSVDRATPAYTCDRRDLELEIAAPARLRGSAAPQSVRWRIGLLQFEYLLRLAHGGTFTILAEECELDLRSLKDRLLSSFAAAIDSGGELDFFVAERHRYSRRHLWIDARGIIKGEQ